jgi:hypothetical protein
MHDFWIEVGRRARCRILSIAFLAIKIFWANFDFWTKCRKKQQTKIAHSVDFSNIIFGRKNLLGKF